MNRWRAVLLLAVFLPASGEDRSRGAMLYRGEVALTARLAGSDDDLAPAAIRCINCHGRDGRGVKEAGVNGEDIRVLVLTRRTGRRGGPPSSYTPAAFCSTLRGGADPAGVVLDRGMPRYAISNADCRALWRFLASSLR